MEKPRQSPGGGSADKQRAVERSPFLGSDGVLVIPHDSDPKYHWWAGGQSLLKTLMELESSNEVLRRYMGNRDFTSIGPEKKI